MASDGFWDVFNEKQAARCLKGTKNETDACNKLVRKAKERRQKYGMSPDDITAMVVSSGNSFAFAKSGKSKAQCAVQ